MEPRSKFEKEPHQAPTRYYVRKVTGIDDEDMVRIILATGASREDIREACDRYFENYYTQSILFRSMSERVRQVYDILYYNRAKPT